MDAEAALIGSDCESTTGNKNSGGRRRVGEREMVWEEMREGVGVGSAN